MTGACALGLGRPVILVSRSVADALSDESLDEIVMHEQAHLDRYDDWSQLLLAVVGSLAGLHPAVRFLARRLDVDREAACDDRVVSCTGATRRYASSLLAVAAASNPEARGVEFAAGVPTATTTASALRVRVGRLLDPRRDRGARLASATSLVSVTALALAVVHVDAGGPRRDLPRDGGERPRRPGRRRAGNRNAAARRSRRPHEGERRPRWGSKRPPRRTSTRVTRPTQSDPPEAAVHPFAGTHDTWTIPPTVPLDSRVIAADANAPVLAVSLPSSQPAAIASAPTPVAPPWDAVERLHDVCRQRCRARRCGDRRPRPERRRLNRPFLYTRRQSRREHVLSALYVKPCGSVALLVEAPLCVCSSSTRVMCRSARL